ncbi:MAG: dihydrodipicolinate synthase family protein [Anaerolineae bacterium]|nr:dihydrodipicolinate synthase family protein [Anaerolineae bacterium]
MAREIKGIGVPLITPFHEDETVNEDAMRVMVKYMLDNGVHGLFPAGSTGESYALSFDEKKRITDIVLEENAGRAWTMVGTGTITTRESVRQTKWAESMGVDAVSVITPYFIGPSEQELVDHYVAICESVSMPVYAYNNPGRTGVALSPAAIGAIATRCSNFKGVKDSSGDLTNAMAYIDNTPPDFGVFMGRDTIIYAALRCGCVGAVAATANVVPDLVVGIYEAWAAGDDALALERQRKLAPLRHAFGLVTFPGVMKDALNLMSYPAGAALRPITPIAGAKKERLAGILRDMGYLK